MCAFRRISNNYSDFPPLHDEEKVGLDENVLSNFLAFFLGFLVAGKKQKRHKMKYKVVVFVSPPSYPSSLPPC